MGGAAWCDSRSLAEAASRRARCTYGVADPLDPRGAEDASVLTLALAIAFDDPLVTALSLGPVECGVRETEHSLWVA